MFLNKSELIGTYLLHILIQTKLKKYIFSSQYFSNSLRKTDSATFKALTTRWLAKYDKIT